MLHFLSVIASRNGSTSASRFLPESGRPTMSAIGRGANVRSWRHPAIGGRVRFTGVTGRMNRQERGERGPCAFQTEEHRL